MAYYKPDINGQYLNTPIQLNKQTGAVSPGWNDHDSTWKAGSFPNQALCSSGGVC